MGVRFYLGCPEPAWLRRTDVPLLLSRTRLQRVRSLPPARGPWALDSGGFTELHQRGGWTVSPAEYVAETRRYVAQLGEPDFCAIQDCMVEDGALARTGRSAYEHQIASVLSYATLATLAPELPWLPTLQGVTIADYLRCARMYAAMGIDLAAHPRVGLGSMCRRQNSVGAALLLDRLVDELGLRNLHAFGFKIDGLALAGERVASADSQAWSYALRRRSGGRAARPCPWGRTDCRNCLHAALDWRERVLARWERRRADAAAAGTLPVDCPPQRPRHAPLQGALFTLPAAL